MANPLPTSEPVAPVIAQIAAGPAGAAVGAFFDLDGTLVDGFTATAHAGHRIRSRQSSIGEVFGVIEAALRYRMGRMQFERLVVRAAGYLRGESLAALDELGQQLFTDRVASWIYPQMRELVHAHQERGHTVALCSSALTIHAEPVARFLGVDHVLCNHFAVDEHGRLTGDIVRPVIWGPQKAAAVQRFSAHAGIPLDRSYFYADGDEDTALMELVGHPHPVNPRPRLAAAAVRHGWPVLRVAGAGRSRPRLLRRRFRV
ncbi:HAD family hydrolase [Mycolicibacterium thermoresistibile]